MFNVAARIFKTTYVANIIFEPDSSGLDNFSLCHRIYHTKPADWSEALTVAILSTFQAKNIPCLLWRPVQPWFSMPYFGLVSDIERCPSFFWVRTVILKWNAIERDRLRFLSTSYLYRFCALFFIFGFCFTMILDFTYLFVSFMYTPLSKAISVIKLWSWKEKLREQGTHFVLTWSFLSWVCTCVYIYTHT